MTPNPDRERIDELVGRYLSERESAVDPGRILAGIRERQAGGKRSQARPSRGRLRVAAVAASALLAIAAWAFFPARPSVLRADPIRLVDEARRSLVRSDVDRSYRIEIRLAPGMAERSPFLAALAGFDCRLSARSDRFRIDANRGDQSWSLGQTSQGGVWLAPSRSLGLEFGGEELPEPLSEALDLFHLDLRDLLARLADHYELESEGEERSPSGSTTTRIRATLRDGDRPAARFPRADRPRFRTMTVEIDEDSKRVQTVTLTKMRNDRVLADVTFRLDDAGPRPDEGYSLASRLDPSAPVLGDDRKIRRRREFVRFLGSLLSHGEQTHEIEN